MAGKPGMLSERHRYRCSALLFSMMGRWPTSRVMRPNSKKLDGCPAEPPPPPDDMTDLDIERTRALLQKQGWTLVRLPNGKLVPMRQL